MSGGAQQTLESVWQGLRPHVEWAEGFTLLLIFASHPHPVAELRQRLEDSLQLRTRRLRTLVPRTADEIEAVAVGILDARPGPASGPLWVDLSKHGADEEWRRARVSLLHRLNERRFHTKPQVPPAAPRTSGTG